MGREYQARPTRLKVGGGTVRTGRQPFRERPSEGSSMIIRVWTARATPKGARQSQSRFARKILPKLRGLDGYMGASFLRRPKGREIELLLLTRWRSLGAVRAFAGEDIERAVVDKDAAAILKRWDRRVRHYEVALEDGASGPGKRRRAPSTSRPRPSRRTSSRSGARR